MAGVNVVMAVCSSPFDFHAAVAAPCRDPRSGACALAVSQAASVYGSECLGLPISPEITTLPPFRAYVCTRGVTGPLAAQCGMRVNQGATAAGAAPPPADRATGTAPLALASLLGASATAIGVKKIGKAMFTKKPDGDAMSQILDQERKKITQLEEQVRALGKQQVNEQKRHAAELQQLVDDKSRDVATLQRLVDDKSRNVVNLERQVAETSQSESAQVATLKKTIQNKQSLLDEQGRKFQNDMLAQQERHQQHEKALTQDMQSSHEAAMAKQVARHEQAQKEAATRLATSISSLDNHYTEAMKKQKSELEGRYAEAMEKQRSELVSQHVEVMKREREKTSDRFAEQYDALTADKNSALARLSEKHEHEIKQHGTQLRESLAAEYDESLARERARAADIHTQLAAEREINIVHQGRITELELQTQGLHSTNKHLAAENERLTERLSTHIKPAVRAERARRSGNDMGRFGGGGGRPVGGYGGPHGGPHPRA